MSSDESQQHWLCFSSHLMTHLQKRAKPGLHYPKHKPHYSATCVNPVDPTCSGDAEKMHKDRDRRWIDCSVDRHQQAGCCVKAAAHGSPPLREKLFWLWEPLKLWAAEQINHHTESYVKFITPNSTHKTHSHQVGAEWGISIYTNCHKSHWNDEQITANGSRECRCVQVVGF